MKKPVSFTLVLSLAASFACGSSERDAIFDPNQNPAVPPGTSPEGGPAGPVFGGENTNGLQLDPVNAVVFIDTSTNPPTPATQAFKVIRKDPAGDRDVTAGATFTLERPELGSFNGATFQSVATLPAGPLGQTTGVTVKADGGSTGGKLTIVALRRGSENRDFFFVEPYNEAPTPQNDVLKFKTNIQSVDVAFVTDTTGSMSDEITGIRNALAGNLLTQLQAAIPNVGIAIVSHKDETDGTGNLVRVLSPVTTTLSQAQTAAGQLGASGGGDTPEGQVPAMFHVLTGGAVTGVPAVTPPAGTKGAVRFRAGAVPVVVLTTDASWHATRGGITTAQVTSAFTGAAARFVSLTSDSGGPGNETQADALSDATSSNLPASSFTGCTAGQCCTGVNNAARAPSAPGGRCRLNFKYAKSNPNIGQGVVNAIKAIAVGSTYDVTVIPRNDPANEGGVDATKFIKALRAKDEGDPSQGCPAHPAKDTNGDGIKDTFTQVTVGTPVCFEVIPQTNTTVEPQVAAQFFNAFLDVVGVPGNVKLDERKVLFLVPPKGGVVTK